MQLTTKVRYALMAMVQLAHNHKHGLENAGPNAFERQPFRLQYLADQQQIDHEYLQQIFMLLRRAKLVESVKGPGGGFRLARSACEIKASDILDAVEKPVKITRCTKHDLNGCQGVKAKCLTHEFWHSMEQHLNNFLESHTLADIVNLNYQVKNHKLAMV